MIKNLNILICLFFLFLLSSFTTSEVGNSKKGKKLISSIASIVHVAKKKLLETPSPIIIMNSHHGMNIGIPDFPHYWGNLNVGGEVYMYRPGFDSTGMGIKIIEKDSSFILLSIIVEMGYLKSEFPREIIRITDYEKGFLITSKIDTIIDPAGLYYCFVEWKDKRKGIAFWHTKFHSEEWEMDNTGSIIMQSKYLANIQKQYFRND